MSTGSVGTISVDLQLDDSAFDRALAAAETKATAAGKTIDSELSGATTRTSDRFASFGSIATKALTATGIAAAVAGVASVKMAGDFQQSLNVFQSVSGATAKQMELVAQKARELGQDASLPGISARDAAQALTELAKAGLSVNDSLSASKGVLSLAKAGNLDVADAATIAATALNSFGLAGSQAATVADLLAAAANASTAGVGDIALGLAQVGSGAKQMGVSLKDTITALAEFSNAGIQGQDAGTSLKQMFIQLAAPTKQASTLMKQLGLNFFDAKGNFIGLEQTSGQLQAKLAGLTQEQRNNALATIFGSDSMRVAAILTDQGAAGFDKLGKAVGKQGAATQLAAAQNAGFNGALDNFVSTLQTVGTDLGTKVLPPLTNFLRVMSQDLPPVVDFMTKHGEAMVAVITGIGLAFAAIRIAGFISDLTKATQTLDLFVGVKNANGIRAIGDAIAGIGGGVKTAASKLSDITSAATTAASDTSKAGLSAATGWVNSAASALKAWTVAFATMVADAVKAAVRMTANGAIAAAGWVANALRVSVAWTAAFVATVAKSFWAGLEIQSPATAAALAWTVNAIKIAAVWTAQFVLVVARAVITGITVSAQAVLAAAGWVLNGALVAASWLVGFGELVISAVVTGVTVAAQAVVAAAAWVLQPVVIAAAWVAQFTVIIARAAVSAVSIATQALIASGAWIAQAALASGAWIIRFIALIPFMLGTAIGMAAQAVIVSAAWIAGAVAATAAWIVANIAMLGVFALIVIAVVAIVAFVITHWQQVKDFLLTVWDGIKTGVNAAFDFLKKYWPLILPIILGPLGLLIDLFTQQGRDMIGGLVKGISDNASKVVDKIKEICGQALNAVKSFFGIHSPSTVMADIGTNLMAGLANGITQAGSQATAAMTGVSANLQTALTVPSGGFGVSDGTGAGIGSTNRSVTQNNIFNVTSQADAQLIANEVAWERSVLESFTIDGLELVGSDDYWFEDVDGLDEPDRRVVSTPNPGADGGFIPSPLYGLRPVSVSGALQHQSPAKMMAARSALGQVCQFKRGVDGVKQLKTVEFALSDGRTFTFQAEVTRFKAPNLGSGMVDFLISILAEDPLLYDPAESSTPAILRSTGGGLIIPFVSPKVSAGSSGGSGIATNDGNSDTPTIIELVGPLTSPYVLNQTSGLFMQLNYSVPTGMKVLIDSSDNTILIDGGGSLFEHKADGADFFKLLPGANNIVFSTGSSSDTGSAKLRWNDGSISL